MNVSLPDELAARVRKHGVAISAVCQAALRAELDRKAMPARFEALAAYNARVSQGVVHQPAYVERMAALQAEFDEWNGQ